MADIRVSEVGFLTVFLTRQRRLDSIPFFVTVLSWHE
jgi:hypothetical protein